MKAEQERPASTLCAKTLMESWWTGRPPLFIMLIASILINTVFQVSESTCFVLKSDVQNPNCLSQQRQKVSGLLKHGPYFVQADDQLAKSFSKS